MNVPINPELLELWRELKQAMLRKMGYRQACREIRQLTEYHGDMEDVERLRRLHNWTKYMGRSLVPGPYASGWNNRWYEFGWQDAKGGLCRARKYRNHSYNRGWTNAVLSMREDGQTAALLEKQFEEMREHYWERIGDGGADDYYDLRG